jgi:diaminohydroxyphosphoribosylaminopyrimidine deaminase/5-amino-6-(5-phosphoribosylamino)uracil reductase
MRDLAHAMRQLHAECVYSVLVEGGAQLASSLLDAGFVDRLTIFRAPIVLGAGGLNAFASARPRALAGASRMPVLESVQCGDDIMTTYRLTAI